MRFSLKLSFLFFSLFNFQVYALNCLERFEIGEEVLDTKGEIGTVHGCVQGKIIVKYGSLSRERGYNELYKVEEKGYGNIKKGTFVIDSENTEFTVLNTYEKNKVRLERVNSSYIKKVKEVKLLSYQLENGIEKIKPGINVIYVKDSQSQDVLQEKVEAVYSNKKVKTTRVGATYITNWYSVGDLSVEKISQADDLKKDDIVIDSNDKLRIVQKIFDNDWVLTKSNTYNYIYWYKQDQLFPSLDNGIGQIKPEVVVVADGEKYTRIVKYVFSNKRVYAKRGSYEYWYDFGDLAYVLKDGFESIKPGVRVLAEGEKYTRVVEQVFSNKRVFTKRGSYEYWYDFDQLAYELTNGIDEYKKNSYVINGKDKISQIKYVFSDERVIALSHGSEDLYKLSELSYSVPLAAEFEEGRKYSTDDFNIGKLKLQFSNGKFGVERSENYYGTSHLYLQVDEYDQYKVGDEIYDSKENVAKIESIFENGLVEYKYHSKEYDELIDAIGIIYSEKQPAEVITYLNKLFIRDIKVMETNEQDYYLSYRRPIYSHEQEEWIFKNLIEFYNENFEIFRHNKREKRAVLAYLGDEGSEEREDKENEEKENEDSVVYVKLDNTSFTETVKLAIKAKYNKLVEFVNEGEDIRISVLFPLKKNKGCEIKVLQVEGRSPLTISKSFNRAKLKRCQKALEDIIINNL